MILNGVIDGVEVQRSQNTGPIEGLTVDIRFTELKEIGDRIEASFVYEANYEKELGFLRMTGRLLVDPPNREEKQKLMKSWKDGRNITAGFAEEATNAANYLCTINAPLATRIVDLTPPLVPPAISFSQSMAKSEKEAGQMQQKKKK